MGVIVVLTLVSTTSLDGIWSAPPESQRFGPLSYDSSVSAPLNSIITASQARPTDFRASLRVRQAERPTEFAYILSTATGRGRGLKLSTDKFGNIFVSLGRSSDAVDDYQLIKVSDPISPGRPFTIEVKVSLINPVIEVSVDSRRVNIVEARPYHSFTPENMFLNVSNIEIGGSEGKNLIGEIEDLQIVFGTTEALLDTTAVKATYLIAVTALVIFILGRRGHQCVSQSL